MWRVLLSAVVNIYAVNTAFKVYSMSRIVSPRFEIALETVGNYGRLDKKVSILPHLQQANLRKTNARARVSTQMFLLVCGAHSAFVGDINEPTLRVIRARLVRRLALDDCLPLQLLVR